MLFEEIINKAINFYLFWSDWPSTPLKHIFTKCVKITLKVNATSANHYKVLKKRQSENDYHDSVCTTYLQKDFLEGIVSWFLNAFRVNTIILKYCPIDVQ